MPGPESDTRAPGWYGVPDEPGTTPFAEAKLTLMPPNALRGELPAGVELAVQWPGEAPKRFTGTFPEPPAAARTVVSGCERAEGLLLAYLGDELVGVSFKPTDRFPYHQRYYNQKLVWSACATALSTLLPLQLFHEARLPLALCGDTCTMPLIDRTRVSGITMEVDGEGRVFFAPTFVYAPANATPFIAVNGQSVTPVNGAYIDPAVWHPGPNTVLIRLDELPAWEAELVLPAGRFAPKLGALTEGADFTVDWSGSDWAPGYEVTLYPREPVLKVGGQSFTAAAPPLTARYEPWMSTQPVTRVAVRVTVRLPAEPSPYRLTLVDDVVVDAHR